MPWLNTLLIYVLENIIAFFALVVSALSLYYARLDKRPKLAVDISNAHLDYASIDPEVGPPPYDEVLFVDISNPGEKRIKVTNLIIETKKRSGEYPDFQCDPPSGLPHFLPPGDNMVLSAPTDEVVEWLTHRNFVGRLKMRAIAVDALGKRHRSRPMTLEVPPVP